MNYPKFAIGEEVLVYSVNFPDLQGIEAIITAREYWEYAEDSVTGELYGEGYSYWLDFSESPNNYPWDESSLRKRPSDMSFDQLMESLKTPVDV